MGVALTGEDFAEHGKPRGHRDRVGVIGAAMKDFVLRDKIHHRAMSAKGGQRKTPTNRFRQADHIRLHPKVLGSPAPA